MPNRQHLFHYWSLHRTHRTATPIGKVFGPNLHEIDFNKFALFISAVDMWLTFILAAIVVVSTASCSNDLSNEATISADYLVDKEDINRTLYR